MFPKQISDGFSDMHPLDDALAKKLRVKRHRSGYWVVEFDDYLKDKQIAFCRENENKDIILSIGRRFGYSGDLEYILSKMDRVFGVELTTDFADLGCLYDRKELRMLFADPLRRLDVGCFDRLQVLEVDRINHLTSLSECVTLKALTIQGFRPRSKELNDLENLHNLQILQLHRTNIETLNGLPSAPVFMIHVAFAPQLTEIVFMSKYRDTLKDLSFNYCKKIENGNSVFSFENLERLDISDCGVWDSVLPVKNLPRLRFLGFAGTTVRDGKVAFLADMGQFEFVGFDNKKSYDGKFDASAAVGRLRSGLKENPPRVWRGYPLCHVTIV